MATIIVPTDFSKNAYKALLYATRIFPDERCHILLIHSFENQFSTSTSRIDIGKNEKLYDSIQSGITKQLEEVEQQVKEDCRGLDLIIESFSSAQPLFKMINQLIINNNTNFVVMGTKGASGFKEVFLGSQTVKVIKKIKPIPLFVIPNNTEIVPPTKIAYATDLKIDYAQYPLEIIKEVMRAQNAELHITHIYNQKSPGHTVEDNYRKLKNKLADVEFNTHWISSENNMKDALKTFLEKKSINLLVMMYHKYGFLEKLLKKSFVEQLSFHTEIPLLILPDSK